MEGRAQRLHQKAAFSAPEYFLDDPELLLREKGKKPAELIRSKRVSAYQPRNADLNARKGLDFVDLPAEIRQVIYDYLFQKRVFVHGKHAYKGRPTVVRHAMSQTCQAIRREATVSLMAQTKQVFIDIREEKNRDWSLKIFHHQHVRHIEVKSTMARNMVWVDMPTLKLCVILKVFELKSFDLSLIYRAPIRATWSTLKPDDKLNPENEVLVSSQLSKIVMDRDDPEMPFPTRMPQLREILRCKHRQFRVMLWLSMEVEGPNATDLGTTDLFIVNLILDWDEQSISAEEIMLSEHLW